MKKLLIICPHLSTGGSGQVTANKIALIKNDFDIKVVEYNFAAWCYVVQRNRILDLVSAENFVTLGDNKKDELINLLNSWQPDVVSVEEFPEMFIHDKTLCDYLYHSDRPYIITETTHDSSFNPANKIYMPDKFVFVSPYNAIKYSHLDVPIEIIEYPVDKKVQNKQDAIAKLGLDPSYKHIVIVGLFTQRKNQGYAFELCKHLSDYKIQFHFIGNMADNFKSYWQPLIDEKATNPKLDNCIIHGERSDTDIFYQASDLFLFPSKGDRGNKELNPIVIKEALEYSLLPKLMFNLDVYLNRYNGMGGINFLCGNINIDAPKIIDMIAPKMVNNQQELIIIGTYPNLKSRVELTKQTIQSLKPLGRKIMLVSHYPVDEEIQRMVDYYVYDAYNPLTHHSYYTRFYNHTNNYDAEVNINGLKQSNQSLTVVTNIITATKMAKHYGYDSFFYSTYDVVIHPLDLPIIEDLFQIIDGGAKAYLGTLETPLGFGIQTNGMFFNTEFALEFFKEVDSNSIEHYNAECIRIGAQNFLEDYLAKRTKDCTGVIIDYNCDGGTLLTNSGQGVASNSEYYSIIPIDKTDHDYMFYFYTYNIDERRIRIVINEGGSQIYESTFQISKSREFKKEICYLGKPIEVVMEFYDGFDVYKTERYLMNEQNIGTYRQTGSFKRKGINPKIKLVHLQTTLNTEAEQKSRADLEGIKDFGIEYVLHQNEPYKSLPPTHNCMRPDCVSMELFTEEQLRANGGQTALRGFHYGCYEAFKNAILCEFDCDYLIICEGDAKLEKPMQEFVNGIYEAARLCEENNIGYFSFGDTKTLEHGWLQSNVIQNLNEFAFITNHIIGIQSVLLPKFTKEWLHEQLRNHKWDAADVYFNTIFKKSSHKLGIVHNRITSQYDGISLIDSEFKTFL